MRAGGSCTLQQALTPEAAGVIKQAVTLAKRRGHGQVTPLHVAATMLTVSTGLLRAACLRSHSHPLQCKALELCFNVALNRLPAASSGPMFGIHGTGNSHLHHVPSISNALIAAFKRAQAHQRRGSVENNQSLLAVKIELDQLVISILDDPSVSRVMREACFSSSQVKSNVERVVLSDKTPTSPASVQNNADITSRDTNLDNMQRNSPCLPPPSENESKQGHSETPSRVSDKDVTHVMEHLMDKRRKTIVIIGECMDTIEGAVRGVTDKIRDGSSSDDVAQTFKGVKFVDLSLPSFEYLSREGVEQKLGDLRAHLRSNDIMMCKDSHNNNGVILFLGDLKWIAEIRGNPGFQHLVAELGKLICGVIEDERVWVMGIATLHSYMRCRSGYPSLESIWRLHPVAVPAGSLSFSLIADSDVESGCSYFKMGESGSSISSSGGWLQPLGVGNHQLDESLTCCVHCYTGFEKEAQSSRNSSANGGPTTSTSSLPPWLQQYKDEKNGYSSRIFDDRDYVRELRKKWNLICNSLHGQFLSSERSLKFSSLSPSLSSSGFSYEPLNPNRYQANQTTEGITPWGTDHQSETVSLDPNLSRTSSLPNSGSSSDDIMEIEYLQRFRELNPKNMKLLVNELEQCIPRQKEVIPDIANTVLRCRSGMIKRMRNETWFLFQGADKESKEKIAGELARLIFGSYNSFVTIALSRQSGHERSHGGFEEFADAVSDNPHQVFFIKEIEVSDHNSRAQFKKAIERGKLDKSSGDEVDLRDAIIILSTSGSQLSRNRESLPIEPNSGDEENKINPSLSLDLNISVAHGRTENYPDNSFEFTEYVDKLVLFEIQEL